jgi:prepilin-type N-terminal cleavage/methylation domain-containing protein
MAREATIPNTSLRRHQGFTLLEGLVACVILLILALGVSIALSASYQQSQSVTTSSTAITLARQLSDEIVSKPYTSSDTLGTGAGARSTYTNVSAYNAYSDSSNSLPLLEGGTLDVTNVENYTRQAAVTVGAKPSIDTLSPTTDFAIVTVSVTAPDGQIVSIPEFVAKYAIPRQ